jgi:hypothetical protein
MGIIIFARLGCVCVTSTMLTWPGLGDVAVHQCRTRRARRDDGTT